LAQAFRLGSAPPPPAIAGLSISPDIARVLLARQMAASTATWTSKLGGKYPREQIESLDRAHHVEIQRLRKQQHNMACAECGQGDVAWASVNLGVFVCVSCADVHRALGTHISKVKGCSGTYLWGPDEIARMQEIGNAVAETLYGKAPMAKYTSASKDERVALCKQKYEQRLWAPAKAKVAPAAKTVPALSMPNSEAAPQAVGGLPTPARAPVVDAPIARRAPIDLIDFEDLFADFEKVDAPSGAQQKPQNQQGSQQERREHPRSAHAVADPVPADSPDTGLDAFLTQCLKGSAPVAYAPASIEARTVSSLLKPEEPGLWENFGAW